MDTVPGRRTDNGKRAYGGGSALARFTAPRPWCGGKIGGTGVNVGFICNLGGGGTAACGGRVTIGWVLRRGCTRNGESAEVDGVRQWKPRVGGV